jgi:hypothetical protein
VEKSVPDETGMKAGNFLIENGNIVTFVASNCLNRLGDMKCDASEGAFQESDCSSWLRLLLYVHVLPSAFLKKSLQ